MDAGKKLIIVNSSFKFLIEDLFNEHVMFDKPPVETIKGILQTNRFTRKLFMDMIQEKFIEILGCNPETSFFTLLRYWIRSNENYYEFSSKKVLKNRTYSKDAKLIFQKLFEEICSKFDQEPIKLYCSVCKQEVFEEDGCIHLTQRIDFVEVFEFAQFSKYHCDYDHYEVLVLSKCYKKLAERKISPYIQEIAQDLFDEKCIIPYNPTRFSKYGHGKEVTTEGL
ncbi:6352_t:CDS:2, partial [Dentiscutata heterogama]